MAAVERLVASVREALSPVLVKAWRAELGNGSGLLEAQYNRKLARSEQWTLVCLKEHHARTTRGFQSWANSARIVDMLAPASSTLDAVVENECLRTKLAHQADEMARLRAEMQRLNAELEQQLVWKAVAE